ncbi:hypothetical protein ACH5RR_016229 [Cinchona calisaya]|uniref:RING-type E3 ubiquitin transferase n=1 Tax=Cinchona calisaya TaxID=153742 RepID=A0ABD2ZYS1_9GENT
MAKTTTMEKGVVLEAKVSAEELKRQLQRVVQSIVDEDDYALEATDRAMQTLSCLKELKMKMLKKSGSVLHISSIPPPELFRCPISGQLMNDPVVIASGQTYDRPFIQKWLKDGHRTCPQTDQVLSHTILTPNLVVKEMISRWCKEHGIEVPSPLQDVDEVKVISNADRGRLSSLLENLSSSALTDQKMAAKEIRQITKRSPSFRALFGEIPNSISHLVEPLSSGKMDIDPELQEDLVTTILNLSIHDSNKKLVAENPSVIPLLIEALKIGSIETRSNAAAALFTLSALDSNKYLIGKLGALKPLIELLEEGHPPAMKDAASAIFSLCIVLENKSRAISDGAVGVIMKKIVDNLLMDELLAILAMLACHHKAIEEMAELGAVSFLLDIIRDSTSERNKENCIAILYTMCFNDRTKLREIRKEEDANHTISQLAENGTSRAKRKANGILERLNRYAVANTA